jgi:hypothetical protein
MMFDDVPWGGEIDQQRLERLAHLVGQLPRQRRRRYSWSTVSGRTCPTRRSRATRSRGNGDEGSS